MNFIKEYWFLITFIFAALIGYVEFRVKEAATTEVGGIAFVSPDELNSRIKDVEREVAANAERIENNKQNADKLDNKIERIVDILLEP
jgi:hypothetical protein